MITIYVDLDGVLADFDTHWGDDKTFDKERFRREILDNNMFDKLEVLENSRKLLKDIDNYCNDKFIKYKLEILGSLGNPDNDILKYEIIKQKSDWVAKHFPNTFSKLNFVQHKRCKKYYAIANSLLIDDTKSNIDEFIKEGGLSVLWNDKVDCDLQIMYILFLIKNMVKGFRDGG